jgi:uncharacterized protein YjbJ (UPF0337 family)
MRLSPAVREVCTVPMWVRLDHAQTCPDGGSSPLLLDGGTHMSTDDKMQNKGEELRGKAKEKVGDATGDDSLRAQGERDQSKANLKQAGEKVKDAFKK